MAPELLLHPVRLRIVGELSARARTTGQLRDALPDVPQATLYRHVATLLEGGAIEVVDERPVRGAVERTYRVRHDGDRVDPASLVDLDADEHMVLFTTFTAALLDTLSSAMAEADPADLLAAGLSYATTVVHLSPEERAHYTAEFTRLVEEMRHLEPAGHRRAHTLATATIPHAGGGSDLDRTTDHSPGDDHDPHQHPNQPKESS